LDYKCVSIQPAVHCSTLAHTGLPTCCYRYSALLLSTWKYSSWILNTYTFIAQKWQYLQKKIAELHH